MRTAIDKSPMVFVGTVTEVENSRRWAKVAVEEVWAGSDIPAEVAVHAGPKDPPGPTSVASSVDRHYRLGGRYLFIPYERKDTVFIDNACTRTTLFRPGLERFSPLETSSPSPDGTLGNADSQNEDEDGLSAIWLLAAVAAALVGGITMVQMLVKKRRT